MKRLRIPGVHPIEIWDAPCLGGVLQDFRHGARLASALVAVIASLPSRLAGASDGRVRDAAARLRHVHLLGGGASGDLQAELAAAGLSCSLQPDATFAAARAGLRRLEGTRAPLVVDIGQTSLKVCSLRGAWRVERDLARAPMREGVTGGVSAGAGARGGASAGAGPGVTDARQSTRAFIGEVIAAHAPCDRLLLALPAEVDAQQRLGPCTYAWGDDAGWLESVAQNAGAGGAHHDHDHDARLPPGSARSDQRRARNRGSEGADEQRTRRTGGHDDWLTLLNDAELAGAAWLDARPTGAAHTTLVLTIGFGVGAALVEAP